MNKFKSLIIAGAALALVAAIVLPYMSWRNAVTNQGNTFQVNLNKEYQSMQVDLSNCLDTSVVASQIAVQDRQSVKDILVGYASARTEKGGSQGSSALAISAIHESVPTISDKLFGELMNTAVGCRNKFAGTQDRLLDYGRRFDEWTQTGPWYEKSLRQQWPNDKLKVVGANGKELTGRAALEFMTKPITTQAATQAAQTHEMPSQQLFPSSGGSNK